MFDLEAELKKWRQQMTASGVGSPAVIRELEEHLREDIDRCLRNGTSPPEAFRRACERLGNPNDLTREFDIARSAGIGSLWRRHGKMVGICVAVGLAMGAGAQALRPRPYVSEAKLLLRAAVPLEPATVAKPDEGLTAGSPEMVPDTLKVVDAISWIMSRELAEEIARTIGPRTVLGKFRVTPGDDLAQAVFYIRTRLAARPSKGSSIIHLSFSHPDDAVVQTVLGVVVSRLSTEMPDVKIRVESNRYEQNPAERVRITATVIAAMELLLSPELAREVAQAVEPRSVLEKVGGGDDLAQAAAVIRNGLEAKTAAGSSIIHLSFRHPDPTVAQPVLREIVARFSRKMPDILAESYRISPGSISFGSTPISSVVPIQKPSHPYFDFRLVYRQTATALSTGMALGLLAASFFLWRAHRAEKRTDLA